MLNSDWKEATWDYDQLMRLAHRSETSIVEWLRQVGVIPADVKWRRAPMSIYNGLERKSIKARALAELAYEFDTIGVGTPKEYMNWLYFEIKDSPVREQFMAVLATLGKLSRKTSGI